MKKAANNRWDHYFYDIATIVGKQSRCLFRSIGAVIVRDDRFIISTGFNGPPPGFPNPGTQEWIKIVQMNLSPGDRKIFESIKNCDMCPRKILGYQSSEDLALCPCAHAERNAISIAARLGVSTKGTTMFLDCEIPCRDCAHCIVTSGIREIVVSSQIEYDKTGISGKQILQECNVKIRTYETENKVS